MTLGRTFIPKSADAGTVKTGDELDAIHCTVDGESFPAVVGTPAAQSGAKVAKRK